MKIEDLIDSDGVWIAITKVAPLTFVEINDFGIVSKSKGKQEELKIGEFHDRLPQNMKEYYRENFKTKFYKESVIACMDKKDEMLSDKMIEIYTVKYKFPSIFCMQEIIKVKQIRRNPIDEAIRSVQKLNEKYTLKRKLV